MNRTYKTTSTHGRTFLWAVWCLIVPLLQVGCSKEPVEGIGQDNMEIIASATLPDESSAKAATKATVDGSTDLTLSFARVDETSAGTYGAYGEEFTGARAAGTGSAVLAFDPVQYYLKDGLKTKITGWYPGGATEAGSGQGFYDASVGTVSWTIDGQQDIIAATQEGSSTVAMPGFVFTHQLTQIQFWPYAESAAVAAQWGAIESITLQEQPDQCTLTLPQGGGTNAEFSAAGSADFTVRNLPADNLPTTAAIQGDPMMVAPLADNTALNLVIDMADGERLSVTIPERSYPAGSVTAVKLRFTPLEVQVEPTVTISDWATGGNKDVTVKSPASKVAQGR